jgi:hypothetical protein
VDKVEKKHMLEKMIHVTQSMLEKMIHVTQSMLEKMIHVTQSMLGKMIHVTQSMLGSDLYIHLLSEVFIRLLGGHDVDQKRAYPFDKRLFLWGFV